MVESSHIFDGHTGRIYSLAVTALPDGSRYAASASHDRTVHVWCLNSMKLLRVLAYSDFVWRVFVVLAPQPLIVAFISAEDKIQVSDLFSGETVNVIFGRLLFAGNVGLFPCPIVIIASANDDDISFIDALTGTVLRSLRGGFEKVFRAVVSPLPQSSLVFTTWNAQNRRSTIQAYPLWSKLPSTELSEHLNSGSQKEEQQQDSKSKESNDKAEKLATTIIASTTVSTTINTTGTLGEEVDRERVSLLFEGDSRDGVTSLVITLGSCPVICSGHYDSVVRLWSIQTKLLLRVLEGHQDVVGSVAAWKGPEPYVISGSSDASVRVWDVNTGLCVTACEGHTRDIWSLAVAPPIKPVRRSGARWNQSSALAFQNSTSGANSNSNSNSSDVGNSRHINSGTIPPSAVLTSLIVSGSHDKTLRVWDIAPLLRDLCWERRKAFCLFLQRAGFILSSRPSSPAATTTALQQPSTISTSPAIKALHEDASIAQQAALGDIYIASLTLGNDVTAVSATIPALPPLLSLPSLSLTQPPEKMPQGDNSASPLKTAAPDSIRAVQQESGAAVACCRVFHTHSLCRVIAAYI